MAWKNENALLRKERVKNKSWFTRVKSWWNNLLNPDHDWLDYEAAPDSINSRFDNFVRQAKNSIGEFTDTLLSPGTMTSLVNSWTGAGPTGQQIWANETQMQNAEDLYQRQVTGMQKAGLNPALMYQNGSSSNAPTVQGHSAAASMSDVMQAVLAKKQAALLDAQSRNVDADTDKKKAETSQLNLINEYYPRLTDTTIDKMLTEIGLDKEQIRKVRGEVDLQELDKELKRLDQVIKRAEADESSAYFKAVRQFQEASTEKAKAEKAELVVRAAMETIEKDYMKETNTKMGTANILAIASFLGTVGSNIGSEIGEGLSGLFDTDGFTGDMKALWKKFTDWLYESGNFGSW